MLRVEHLRKVYGEGGPHSTVAIQDLSFEVRDRELLCIVGPSGCGKTTLLKCASGLLPASGGSVVLDGRPVNGPPEQMALVFQEYGRSLFPWMTVDENVRFPLRRKRLARPEQNRISSQPDLKQIYT